VILDHNKNPVPDGTVVHFIFTLGAADTSTQSQVDTTTTDGVARATYRIPSAGSLQIQVVSDPALTSKLLRLDISSTGAVAITAITPTPQPSITPTMTQTVTPSPTATLTPTSTPLPPVKTDAGDWALSNLIAWGAAFVIFLLGRSQATMRWAIRWALLAVFGGLVGYMYLTINLPGSQIWMDAAGKWGTLISSLIGTLVGWSAGVFWKYWLSQRARMEKQARRVNGPV
jgi:beta-N-acetylhexosaminidase